VIDGYPKTTNERPIVVKHGFNEASFVAWRDAWQHKNVAFPGKHPLTAMPNAILELKGAERPSDMTVSASMSRGSVEMEMLKHFNRHVLPIA
jgi:hypothetical protein